MKICDEHVEVTGAVKGWGGPGKVRLELRILLQLLHVAIMFRSRTGVGNIREAGVMIGHHQRVVLRMYRLRPLRSIWVCWEGILNTRQRRRHH